MISKTLKIPFIVSSIPAALAAGGAVFYLVRFKEENLIASICAGITLFILLLPYLMLMSKKVLLLTQAAVRTKPWALAAVVGGFLLCYGFFALGTKSFAWDSFIRLFLFLTIPALVCKLADKRGSGVNFFDALLVFLIWIPFDTGLIKQIWLFPHGEGAYVLNAIIAVSFAMILFGCIRGHRGIGYEVQCTKENLKVAAIGFLIFFAIALTVGTLTGFIKYNGNVWPWKTLAAFPGILLFIGIPEELLFRGLFQNFLTQKTKKPVVAILVAGTIFGLTHFNNTPSPDWRYLLLASIAGYVYGWAFHRTKNLTACALIHAGIDAVWVGFFM